MTITYSVDRPITVEQFIGILERSTLAERRPVEDRDCIAGMIRNANLIVTAWDGGTLVGVARSVTDFHYACYLSDLAVDLGYQNAGIGRELVRRTQGELGPWCKIRLISAPAAVAYYPKIGFTQNLQCWELAPRGPGDTADTAVSPTG